MDTPPAWLLDGVRLHPNAFSLLLGAHSGDVAFWHASDPTRPWLGSTLKARLRRLAASDDEIWADAGDVGLLFGGPGGRVGDPIVPVRWSVAGRVVGTSHMRCATLARATGEPLGALGVIVRWQNPEPAARSELSEAASRAIMDVIPELVFECSAEGKIVHAGDRFCAFTGLPRGELLGRPWWTVAEDDAQDRLAEAWRESATDPSPLHLEARLRRWDGEHRFFESRIAPIFDADGVLSGWAGVHREVHEVRRAFERQLEHRAFSERLAHERLRLVAIAGRFGIWDWDVDADELIWNDHMYSVYGAERGSMHSYAEWRSSVHPDDAAEVEAAMHAALAGDRDLDCVYRIVRGDGVVRTVHSLSCVVRDPNGRALRMVGVDRDITDERDQIEELKSGRRLLESRKNALERSNEDLEQFAYAASHDLQEPLRAVAGCGQILDRDYREQLDERGQLLLRHMVDGADRMSALVKGLLHFSRATQGDVTFVEFPILEAIEMALQNLRESIDATGASVDIRAPMPLVNGDRSRLAILFQNLIANAIKYRGEGTPEIRIEAEPREDGRWEFRVIDNGIGIAPQHRKRVFLIFQRLHARDAYPGTGVGLAICERIVRRHGGEIAVRAAEDGGAVFVFDLGVMSAGGGDEHA